MCDASLHFTKFISFFFDCFPIGSTLPDKHVQDMKKQANTPATKRKYKPGESAAGNSPAPVNDPLRLGEFAFVNLFIFPKTHTTAPGRLEIRRQLCRGDLEGQWHLLAYQAAPGATAGASSNRTSLARLRHRAPGIERCHSPFDLGHAAVSALRIQ